MAKKKALPKDMSALFHAMPGTLAHIATKTNSLAILTNIVSEICPDLPEDVWHIANFKQNTLVIEVNSSVWSQRLQFERNNICRALALQTDNQFCFLEIKIAPYRNKKIPDKLAADKALHALAKGIPQSAADHLNEIAQHAPQSLKQKLERLAKLAR